MPLNRTGEGVRRRRCGVQVMADDSICWRVWAPRVQHVDLVLIEGAAQREIRMKKEEGGFHRHVEKKGMQGQRYAFRLQGGPARPDPCSLWQPEGPHAPSALFRPERFLWTDQAWGGVERAELVIYELHVGTFTPQGTFDAIIPRLSALRDLGVTALEIMPVAQFPGNRNWGYDGVSLYAPQNSYGGPEGMQRLVDACHAAGLALLLDVVYNHLGPEGNYLREFGPYFTDHYRTPWGSAINYDGAGSEAVRDFVLDNVRMWLQEYHCDGLRLDAVHAIYDLGACSILQAIQKTAQEVAGRTGRAIHIIAESDLNDPRILLPPERGGVGLDAQWSDDFHHAVHAYLTGERHGYYMDFGHITQLADVLQLPFLYAGHDSPFRQRKHGAPVPEDLRGDRFVVCLQNHDQVGNRACGDRLGTICASPAKQRLATSLLLLSPYLPLLFMGEEYGEENPFPFFCSFGDPDLVQAVRAGRQREFAEFAWRGEIPDPQGVETFVSARLSWSWPEGTLRAGLRQLYRDLLTARREWPALRDWHRPRARLLPDSAAGPVLEFLRGDPQSPQQVRVFYNLGDRAQAVPRFASEPMILFRSEAPSYAVNPREMEEVSLLAPHECMVFGPSSWKRFPES